MNDVHTYLIQLNGQVNISELNTNSPLEMKSLAAEGNPSSFAIQTDQSGLIGLLRHLHARGLVIRSLTCQPNGEKNVNPSCFTPDVPQNGLPDRDRCGPDPVRSRNGNPDP